MKNLKLWLYIVLVSFVVRALIFVYSIYSPINIADEQMFFIESGDSLGMITEQLSAQKIINNAFDLKLYGRLSGKAGQIKAGQYLLNDQMTAQTMLEKFVQGDVFYHQLVVPEGWTLKQAITVIQQHPEIETTFAADDSASIQEIAGTDFYPEGMFFPDTYNFAEGTTDREILVQGFKLMAEVLEQAWPQRDVGLPYESPYEVLIMASIVEKETALASEREMIAGVFIRRIQQNMRLQTDPTVIYGLGERFNGNLTVQDLRKDTPYNTYTNSGLPPTPIALPGRESILASLHPDQGSTLYFVARGDGGHQFSDTLEEHNQAVRRYQLNSQPDEDNDD